MSFVSIQTAIYSALDAVKATHGIHAVYKYPLTEVGTTPAVTVELGQSDEDFEDFGDTSHNELTTRWIVRIIVERTTADSTQYAKLLDLIDDVMGILRDDANDTLGGVAHLVKPFAISPIYPAQYGDVKVFACDISFEAKTLKTL